MDQKEREKIKKQVVNVLSGRTIYLGKRDASRPNGRTHVSLSLTDKIPPVARSSTCNCPSTFNCVPPSGMISLIHSTGLTSFSLA